MFDVKKVNEIGYIYPDAEFLSDYEDSDIGSLLSTLGVEAVIGQRVRQIGDSGIYVCITDLRKRNEEGIEQLKVYTKDMISIIKEALPGMSSVYADFYRHFLDDFEKNGFVMPMHGQIIAPDKK